MSGIGVEKDQSGDLARIVCGVDSRERSSDRIANEEEFRVGCELLEDGVEVFGDLYKVVTEWPVVCGVRVCSEAIELGESVVGKESKSSRTLKLALVIVVLLV